MFEGIKYRRRLRKLDNEARRINEVFAKQKKGLSGEELKLVISEEKDEVFPVFEEIDLLRSARIYGDADRLNIPLPDMPANELWEELHHIGRRILTRKAQWELKKRIHEEKRQRRQWIVLLTALIAVITGAIGATAGLAAVLGR